MVRAGIGSAVLPRLAVHAAGVRGDDALRVHALRPAPHPREIHLLWRAGRTHSPLAARTDPPWPPRSRARYPANYVSRNPRLGYLTSDVPASWTVSAYTPASARGGFSPATTAALPFAHIRAPLISSQRISATSPTKVNCPTVEKFANSTVPNPSTAYPRPAMTRRTPMNLGTKPERYAR